MASIFVRSCDDLNQRKIGNICKTTIKAKVCIIEGGITRISELSGSQNKQDTIAKI